MHDVMIRAARAARTPNAASTPPPGDTSRPRRWLLPTFGKLAPVAVLLSLIIPAQAHAGVHNCRPAWKCQAAPAPTATPTPSPTATPSPTPTAPSSNGQLYGFQVHMWGPGTTTGKLDALQQAGAKVLRVDFGWTNLEYTGKGRYDLGYLDQFDQLVDGAAARGIKVIVTVWRTPCWASSMAGKDCSNLSADGYAKYPPSNPADYADAIRFLARRWGSKVLAYEVWNEPNQGAFWAVNSGRDPAVEYAKLLAGAYDDVKATDPDVRIIGGSLANADYDWTRRILAAGGAHKFDGWSVHPYSFDRSPLQHDYAYPFSTPIDGVPMVHDQLLAYGDKEPLWLTEFGHSTCSARNQPYIWLNCVSEADQATYMTQYLQLFESWPYVAGGTYYELLDGGSTDTRENRYGVIRLDGSRKPAFDAFRNAAP